MSFARARAIQSLRNGLRQSSARPAIKSNTFRRAQLQAKRYASSGGEHKSSSDLPWLISALVITPVSCYYLWPSSEGHAHHDSHDKHEKHDDDKPAEEEPAEEESKKSDEEESKKADESDDQGKEEKADDKSEKEDDDDEDKSSKKGGDSSVKGVNFKGKMKPDSDGAEHNVKVESDSKGENKKRLDSGLQKNLGPASDGDRTSTSGKQDGLSNTQSRHSTPIHESNEKSKKADGTPETSKAIGTVD